LLQSTAQEQFLTFAATWLKPLVLKVAKIVVTRHLGVMPRSVYNLLTSNTLLIFRTDGFLTAISASTINALN